MSSVSLNRWIHYKITFFLFCNTHPFSLSRRSDSLLLYTHCDTIFDLFDTCRVCVCHLFRICRLEFQNFYKLLKIPTSHIWLDASLTVSNRTRCVVRKRKILCTANKSYHNSDTVVKFAAIQICCQRSLPVCKLASWDASKRYKDPSIHTDPDPGLSLHPDNKGRMRLSLTQGLHWQLSSPSLTNNAKTCFFSLSC